jgi:hypothetical protein
LARVIAAGTLPGLLAGWWVLNSVLIAPSVASGRTRFNSNDVTQPRLAL